jgi:hypothetical protein
MTDIDCTHRSKTHIYVEEYPPINTKAPGRILYPYPYPRVKNPTCIHTYQVFDGYRIPVGSA